MTAVSQYKNSQMRNSIVKLFNRMTSHLQYEISHDDFVELFIPPHLREMAYAIPKHFDVRYRPNVGTINMALDDKRGARLALQIYDTKSGEPAPMLPREMLTPPPDHPVMLKVTDYIQQYAEVSKQFSLAIRVLEELDKHCGSEMQMRFFWPAMLILLELSGDEELKKTADKLRASKPPRNAPYLPEWVRAACRDTSSYIAAASMIEEAHYASRSVGIVVQSIGAFEYAGERISSIA